MLPRSIIQFRADDFETISKKQTAPCIPKKRSTDEPVEYKLNEDMYINEYIYVCVCVICRERVREQKEKNAVERCTVLARRRHLR